jgi:hypothetical protein
MITLGLYYSRSSPFYFQLRAYYYTVMRSVEDDEEAQKRGVVGCAYCVGGGIDIDMQDMQLLRKAGSLRSGLPVRFESLHVCYNNPRMSQFLSLGMLIVGTRTRMRFRAHYGTGEECRLQLSTFGIPISALPVSPRSEFNLANHWAFVAMQRAIEATKSKRKEPPCVAQKAEEKPFAEARTRQPIIKEDVFVAVLQPVPNKPTGYGGFMSFNNLGSLPQPSFANSWWSVVGAPNSPLAVVPPPKQPPMPPPSHRTGPTSASRLPAKICESPAKSDVIYDLWPNDVLFGKGKPIQQRSGNVRFREMIDAHIDKYAQGVNGTKVVASAYVVHLVKEEGGRFLKELKDGGWIEVDETTARAKTSHAFRTRRQLFQAMLKKDKSTF